MARLPQPGADQGTWGDVLNDFLSQAHEGDGSLKDIPQTKITNLATDLAAKIPVTQKATANGVATLGSNAKLADSQVPAWLENSALRSAYDTMPEVYIDARSLPAGSITQVTRGQFAGSYGNSPAFILDGAIQHTPNGVSNTASYVEATLSGETRRVGALVEWPDLSSTSLGGVALIIPDTSWTNSAGTATQIGTAGVHVVVNANGSVTQARYEGSTVNQAQGRTNAALTGGRHVIEVVLDDRTSTIRVYVDNALIVEKKDTTAFGMLSDRAIWELYEFTGSSLTPAKFLATWADTERRVPSGSPFVVYPSPPPRAVATQYSTTATYTLTQASSTAIDAAVSTTSIILPRSGQALVRCSAWVDGALATGPILGQINGSGAMRLAEAGFKGRLIWERLVNGTEGQSYTIQPNLWTTSGSLKVEIGGAFGNFMVSAIPL